MQTTRGRRQAFFAGTVLVSFGVGVVFIYAYASSLVHRPELFITPIVRLIGISGLFLAMALVLGALVAWCTENRIDKGIRYALLSAKLHGKTRKALLESGFYIRIGRGMFSTVRLPQVALVISDDLKSVSISVENHPALDRPLDMLLLSSCLGYYVEEQHYLTADSNWYVFDLVDCRTQKQTVFENFEEFSAYSRGIGQYELPLDEKNQVPLSSALHVGQTGSGKSHTIFSRILLMLCKPVRYVLYFADAKQTGLLSLGMAVAPERTAGTVEEIIVLLRDFVDNMELRKSEIQENKGDLFDPSYEDLNLEPHVFLMEEYAAVVAYLSTAKKELRDEFLSLLKRICMQGRQLGFFLWIIMQQSGATVLSTDLRENLPLKVLLGQPERSTAEMIFGASAVGNIPNKRYLPGTGVFTYPGLTHMDKPKPCFFPTLRFDVRQAIIDLSRTGGHCNEMTPSPPRKRVRKEMANEDSRTLGRCGRV